MYLNNKNNENSPKKYEEKHKKMKKNTRVLHTFVDSLFGSLTLPLYLGLGDAT